MDRLTWGASACDPTQATQSEHDENAAVMLFDVATALTSGLMTKYAFGPA